MAAVAVFMMIVVAFAPAVSIITDDQGADAAATSTGALSGVTMEVINESNWTKAYAERSSTGAIVTYADLGTKVMPDGMKETLPWVQITYTRTDAVKSMGFEVTTASGNVATVKMGETNTSTPTASWFNIGTPANNQAFVQLQIGYADHKDVISSISNDDTFTIKMEAYSSIDGPTGTNVLGTVTDSVKNVATSYSITGKVVKADGTAVSGAKVSLGSVATTKTNSAGTYTFKTAGTGGAISVDTGIWTEGVNPVQGYTFPTLTVGDLTSDVSVADLKATTVKVSATLMLKDTDTIMYVNTAGADQSTVSGDPVAGVHTLFVAPSTQYAANTVSSTYLGIIFSNTTAVTVQNTDLTIKMKAASAIVYGNSDLPVEANASIVSGLNGTTNMYYSALPAVASNITLGYGSNGISTTVAITLAEATAAKDINRAASPKYITGEVLVAPGITLTGAVVTLTSSPGSAINISTVDGKYYFPYSYSEGTTYTLSVGTTSGLTFPTTAVTITSSSVKVTVPNISANNVCSVAGTIKDASGVATKDVEVSVGTGVTAWPSVIKSDSNGSYKAYVVKSTEVALSCSGYSPASYEYTVNTDIANANFTGIAISTVTYTGEVEDANDNPLKGIDVKYSIDGGVTFTSTTATDKDGKYTFTAPAGTTVLAYAVSASPYTFPAGYVPVDTEPTMKLIKANEATYTGSVSDNGSVNLGGVTISVNEYATDNVFVSTVTSAITNENGEYSFTANKIKTENGTYGIVAKNVKSAFGDVTFATTPIFYESSSFATIKSAEQVYSGYYAQGEIVNGVTVTYSTVNSGSPAITTKAGTATVIGNKYYITATDDEFKTGYKLNVNAIGDNFVATGNNLSYDVASVDSYNLTVSDINITADIEFTTNGVSLASVIGLDESSEAKIGSTLYLNATNEGYIDLHEGSTLGSDYSKMTFKAWYVNGDLYSKDLNTTYTVEDNATIYAEYSVSFVDAVPGEPGINSTVLIIGIIAVVIALIAVAYVVIQTKKD